MFSLVITTYNRAYCVCNAVRSAVVFCEIFDDLDVIVVDDASTDNTESVLMQAFSSEFKSGVLKYIKNKVNLGVTGSKNTGYLAARHKWVGFLDSDDVLLKSANKSFYDKLMQYKDVPIVFFRCVDENGKLVGTELKGDQWFDLRRYLRYYSHGCYGETFIVINKSMVKFEPFCAELRGYEGVGCTKIISKYGAALLSSLVVRIFIQSGVDRQSRKRSSQVYRSVVNRHLILIKEFGNEMPWYLYVFSVVKIVVGNVLVVGYSLCNK